MFTSFLPGVHDRGSDERKTIGGSCGVGWPRGIRPALRLWSTEGQAWDAPRRTASPGVDGGYVPASRKLRMTITPTVRTTAAIASSTRFTVMPLLLRPSPSWASFSYSNHRLYITTVNCGDYVFFGVPVVWTMP